MPPDALIETNAITKRYRRTVALRELSVSIQPGGVTALLGPNGAGKSTLLKLCIGFERPSAGSLRVLGIDPTRRRADALHRIGYVPQAPSLYRDLTIEDHLALARALRPSFDVAHARDRVASLGLSPGQRAGQLSGGEQAQVSLALALGTRAPLLLLDEPLASLDPLARREFTGIAADAARRGDVSIILSSHVLSEIEPVADRCVVLGDGRVIFDDSVASSLRAHRVLDDGASLDGLDIVSRFPGAGESRHVLIRSGDAGVGRSATLEEVVIGYLALDRADRLSRAA